MNAETFETWLEDDVVVFASLIALRLVVFFDLLPSDGVHTM
jgi:hypothetical protein